MTTVWTPSYIIDRDLQQSNTTHWSISCWQSFPSAHLAKQSPTDYLTEPKWKLLGARGARQQPPVPAPWPKFQLDWHLKVGDFYEVCHLPRATGVLLFIKLSGGEGITYTRSTNHPQQIIVHSHTWAMNTKETHVWNHLNWFHFHFLYRKTFKLF